MKKNESFTITVRLPHKTAKRMFRLSRKEQDRIVRNVVYWTKAFANDWIVMSENEGEFKKGQRE